MSRIESDDRQGYMETLTAAMVRLRDAGYRADFSAAGGGQLLCSACGMRAAAITMLVHEVVRFEGDSNPEDEAVLFALSCSCGCLGQYSSSFGVDVPPEDVAVLRHLAESQVKWRRQHQDLALPGAGAPRGDG
jgi:hypothetical protein